MHWRTHASLALLASSMLTCSCGDGASTSDDENLGGSVATGGSGATSGGTAPVGGQVPTGGLAPTGGVAPTGGMGQTGGVAPTGGAAPTGGVAQTGGEATETGGAVGTGGDPTETGGATGTGGNTSDTGGAAGTGGNETGGTDGSGGEGTGGGGSTSPGCGSANTSSPCSTSGTTCNLDVNGTPRAYYVQLPSSYDPSTPYPLIFQFHPWGGSAEMAMTMYQLNSKIPNAIYVSPQGLEAGGAGAGWANSNGEDIAFTQAMLDDIQSKYCIDNDRIFSTGFSYGGMMSFAIGCEMSDVFRAIAPMAGSLYSDFNCQGTGPAIAMWGAHGTSDTVVPIDDGRAALAKILQQSHCGTETTPVEPSPCVMYQGCDPGYEVTWCEWDGPHGIPPFGSDAVAAFFLQF